MSEWDDIGTCLSNRRGLAARLFDQSDICKMQQVTERNSRKREEKKASERKIIQEKEKVDAILSRSTVYRSQRTLKNTLKCLNQ